MLRRLIVVAALAAVAAVLAPAGLAASPNVVISQVYGGGGNAGATYTHDFIELFNRGTTFVSLAGWSLQYASATGTGNFGATATQITELSGAIPPGGYVLVQEAQGSGGTTPLPPPLLTDATPINMSGTAGKVALVNTTTPLGCNGGSTPCPPAALAQIVDLVGYGGANFFEGTGAAPELSNTTAAFRAGNGCVDTDNNAADFTAAAPAPRNFSTDPITCAEDPDDPVVVTCGAPLTTPVGVAATRDVSATDADGTVTSLAIQSVTPSSAPGAITLTGIAPATTPGGTATATVNVDAAVPAGSYTVTVQATNADGQSGTCSLTVDVLAVRTIGEVQGAVLDSDVATLHRSSFAPPSGNGSGQTVVVRGVITQKTLARSSSGADQNGFFLQNTTTTDDDNPLTSDGIFVFMGGFTSLIGGYVPEVGDEVVISGRVSEFFFFTQLSSASLVTELGSFADLDAVVPAFAVSPPDDLSTALRYWERREGMRGALPAGAKTVDGLDVFASTADGELWVIRGDHPVAQRSDPFARRVFRDPHPLDNQPTPLFDDGNGYRVLLASLGVKFAAGDNTELLAPARTFETVTNALVGGVYFTFGKYALQVTQQPALTPGVDPATNAPPSAFARDEAYSIADYNVENLYDFRDDPFDGCDFNDVPPEDDNRGCPLGAATPAVRPPYDYVPASDAVYQARLVAIATQIVDDLHAPDILLVQEAEDQDICTVAAGALACGTTDNRDGKPDTLQELALRIEADHGIAYDAAYDRDGSDDRGIVSGFLYRNDRVELLPAAADHPVLGSDPDVEYRGTPLPYNTDVSNPKALNADLPDDVDLSSGVDGTEVFTRDPQVGFFRIWRNAVGDGGFIDIYAISNHFSSTPDARRGQRKEQSLYNAAIVEALRETAAGTRIDVGGDFNVFPRPDDPVLPPSDQLGPLYEADLTNLYDVVVAQVPSAAYSYVFQGQTQTLDGQFLTDTALDELNEARIAHVNADFPADTPGDGPRGLSDHDPMVTQLAVPSLEAMLGYYADAGFVTGNNTERQLLRFLARAAAGGPNAEAQLLAFIAYVQAKTPQFIDPLVAEALIDEAERLLG